MKILHLMLACFYIDNYSYQENYLPKYHLAMGNDVEIIASLVSYDENGKPTLLPEARKYINEYGIPVTRLRYRKGKSSRVLRYYIGLKKELERIAPDLIFIHGVQFSDIKVVTAYLKSHSNVKVFVDSHSDFSNSATGWISKNILHRIIWRHYAKKIEPYVTKFYGVLPARVDFLINEYALPASKVELLVMGADEERVKDAANPKVREAIREKLGLKQDDFVVMTGGKINGFKTQTFLLMEAIRNIPDPKVKLVVFGSVTPDLKHRMTALVDGGKVQYIGWVNSNDSYDYFAASDLVVFPGRHSVFWEQVAAQGIPMLVKHWDGTTHVNHGGNVRFLTKDSSEEIRDEILQLLEPRVYASMKQSAEAASANFLYSNIAKRSIEE